MKKLSPSEKQKYLDRIRQSLEEVRPHLAVDGGDVEVMDLTDDMVVKIQWIGSCIHCSMSAMTLKAGIEQAIRNKVPEVTGVEAINGVLA